MEILPRYFLEIAFLGTAYRGWQLQPDRPSVQAEVERAMRLVLRREKVSVVGCGRTDTGVHASRFFLHFDHGGEAPLDDRLVYGLNSLLPDDIGVKRLIAVPDDAHARFSATERGYRYRIHRRKDPFLEGRSHLLRPALDVEAMNTACAHLLGRQDFSSFCKAGSDARTMLCEVRRARWTATPHGCEFEVRADRFLRNMVRAIVGTCLLIGRGHRPPEHMAAVLAARDRSAAGKSAPARGLYLEHITYPFIPEVA
ncbi:MAG: tRNA pseudouridine(38-40) synthase TruA [Flavobacteriales bacterium]|nr:tRNA pseudouridine synthase A [Flavobacteriales bacterium]MCC6576865.1 tRNA pseudouridine(38-40) synthase TruA [Flavobacteriales bacterium]NUQ16451.1 tRNA pseudouridine(38-40) synthase TruA [Flavobacteriales bacterium]